MQKILTFPDGSAIDARFVAGITWNKSSGSGDHRSLACIRVHSTRESLFGRGQTMEQVHYIPMGSDEAAKAACEELVRGWTGDVFKPADAEAS